MTTSGMCIVVLCGLPGSGKSTLASHLCTRYENVTHICYDRLLSADLEKRLLQDTNQGSPLWKHARNTILQCFDGHIEKLVGLSSLPQNNKLENLPVTSQTYSRGNGTLTDVSSSQEAEVDNLICRRFCELFGHIDQPPKCSHVFIIDDNMYYRSMRYQYYQLARKYKLGFCEVFTRDKETSILRNAERSDKVPGHVIDTMATRIEPPDGTHYQWEKHSIIVNTDSMWHLEPIWSLIQTALADPVQPCPVADEESAAFDRLVCSQNMVHQADQHIRRLIGVQMSQAKVQGYRKSELAAMAKHLNSVKTDLLEQLRTKGITVPYACWTHEQEFEHIDSLESAATNEVKSLLVKDFISNEFGKKSQCFNVSREDS